jgi:plasmid stability protein
MHLELRDLDETVDRILRARAAHHGISLEEEVVRTLEASVEAQREEYLRRLQALKEAARLRAEDNESRGDEVQA